MTTMKATASGVRTTARAVKHTAKAADMTMKFNIRHWRALLPLHVVLAAWAASGAVLLASWAMGPWAWVAASGAALVAWVAIDGRIGQLDEAVQNPSKGQLIYGYSLAGLALAAPHLPVPSAAVGAFMVVAWFALAFQWWWGDSAYSRPVKMKRATKKMSAALRGLGAEESTHIIDFTVNSRGDQKYRTRCGDGDRPEKFKPEDIAHMLGIASSLVIVRRVKGDESRLFDITILKSRPDSKRNIPHPALDKANRAEGAAWAPGSRSVLDGLPIGRVLGSMDDAIASAGVFTAEPDAKCLGVFGDTGSGKTNTVSTLLISAAACNNLVVRTADAVKGVLGYYHEQVLHGRADDIDQLIADLEGLLALSRDRNEQLKGMRTPEGHLMLNWLPTPTHPGLLYIMDEIPATLARCNPRQADRLLALLEALPKEVRSAGIAIAFITQTLAAEVIPTTLTSQFGSNFLGHRVKKQHDGAVQGWSVDVTEKGLPGRGQCWVGVPDGGEPSKALAYDASTAITKKNKEWNAMLDEYAAHRPELSQREADITGWPRHAGGASEAAEVGEIEAEETTEVPVATEMSVDELERRMFGETDLSGVEADSGSPIDKNALADAPVGVKVMRALRDADEPLPIAALEAAAGVSRRTVQRALERLSKEGIVSREGESTATVYRLAA